MTYSPPLLPATDTEEYWEAVREMKVLGRRTVRRIIRGYARNSDSALVRRPTRQATL